MREIVNDYQIQRSDDGAMIAQQASAGSLTLTLPEIDGSQPLPDGYEVEIVSSSNTNAVAIAVQPGDTILGVEDDTQLLIAPGGSVSLRPIDGTTWHASIGGNPLCRRVPASVWLAQGGQSTLSVDLFAASTILRDVGPASIETNAVETGAGQFDIDVTCNAVQLATLDATNQTQDVGNSNTLATQAIQINLDCGAGTFSQVADVDYIDVYVGQDGLR
jgi:hypothetical protein